jgi:hypothetical protein
MQLEWATQYLRASLAIRQEPIAFIKDSLPASHRHVYMLSDHPSLVKLNSFERRLLTQIGLPNKNTIAMTEMFIEFGQNAMVVPLEENEDILLIDVVAETTKFCLDLNTHQPLYKLGESEDRFSSDLVTTIALFAFLEMHRRGLEQAQNSYDSRNVMFFRLVADVVGESNYDGSYWERIEEAYTI